MILKDPCKIFPTNILYAIFSQLKFGQGYWQKTFVWISVILSSVNNEQNEEKMPDYELIYNYLL